MNVVRFEEHSVNSVGLFDDDYRLQQKQQHAMGYPQPHIQALIQPHAMPLSHGVYQKQGFSHAATAPMFAVQQAAQPPQQRPPINSNMNRSQRCGVCRGCQCKPCGQCTYCQDSPQFGGPGVKKQSCIERRCLRVLENRLQRDSPSFKARLGCNQCEDCRVPDCQICLVCLDRRFFENRYIPGAMCAKKRCNNSTNLDTMQSSSAYKQRQIVKRCYEQVSMPSTIQIDAKRNQLGEAPAISNYEVKAEEKNNFVNHYNEDTDNSNSSNQSYNYATREQPIYTSQSCEMPYGLKHYNNSTADATTTTSSVECKPNAPASHYLPQRAHDYTRYNQNGDPFLPPSYAPDMKNAVVLQPL